MPFPMRIQPIDFSENDVVAWVKHAQQPASKSRLRRLFDRPFKRENEAAVVVPSSIEPSSLCLDKMVRKFIEDGNNNSDKGVKCGKNRCNCFNGKSNGSSDDEDEFDFFSDSATANSSSSFSDYSDALKSLIPCATVMERNLLADTSGIVEKNGKTCKRKDDLRRAVAIDLIALGYDASVCSSKWDKSSSSPAGEYEYIDVMNDGGDRLIVDVDFRSEFEIARSTSSYRQILQSLPSIFVGKSDRLLQIVAIASEAAKLSLKKKGMHMAPWRKAEYMKSKWAGQCTRIPTKSSEDDGGLQNDAVVILKEEGGDDIDKASSQNDAVGKKRESGEWDLILGKEEEARTTSSAEVVTWQLPAVRARSLERGGSSRLVVTGLASLLKESS